MPIKYYTGEAKEYSFRTLFNSLNAGATGRNSFNGTGAQTVFNIPHGLSATPTSAVVTAGSAASAAAFFVTTDATNVIVTFTAAPASGTNNVVLNWSARV
jgi:hypothetical protein